MREPATAPARGKKRRSPLGRGALQALILRTLWRRGWLWALLTLLPFAGCLGALVMGRQLHAQQAAWAAALRETRIQCVITDSAGGQDYPLDMEWINESLALPSIAPFVRDIHYMFTNGNELYRPKGYSVCYLDSLQVDPRLATATVTLYEGYDEQCLAGSELVCLVPEGAPVYTGADGKLWIDIDDSGQSAPVAVAGTVSGGPPGVIYLPFYAPATNGRYYEKTASRCTFTIADNARLEEARAALYTRFAQVKGNGNGALSEQFLNGVIIQDEDFLAVRSVVQSNMALLRILLPLLLAGMAGVGFLVTALFAAARRRELAVLRCLGMRRRTVLGQIAEEQAVCAGVGALAAALPGAALGALEALPLGCAGAILLAFFAGGLLAAARLTGVPPMELMKTEE